MERLADVTSMLVAAHDRRGAAEPHAHHLAHHHHPGEHEDAAEEQRHVRRLHGNEEVKVDDRVRVEHRPSPDHEAIGLRVDRLHHLGTGHPPAKSKSRDVDAWSVI